MHEETESTLALILVLESRKAVMCRLSPASLTFPFIYENFLFVNFISSFSYPIS